MPDTYRRRISRGVHLQQADLLAEGAVDRLVSAVQPTHLLHVAWEATPGAYWTSELNVAWVGATLALARAAVALGCRRIVAIGSCAEYDWGSGGVFNESHSRVAPASLYGASKAATSQVLQAYCVQLQVSFAWARVFFEYGPHEHPTRLVPTVIRSVLARQLAECSHGEQLRDFLCSVDVGRLWRRCWIQMQLEQSI